MSKATAAHIQALHETPRHGSGFPTLLWRETYRFLKIAPQTILAPVIGNLLYLIIFSQALGSVTIKGYGIMSSYVVFMIPGLVMMTLLMNAFINPASAILQSRIQGYLIFSLISPISPSQFYLAYSIAAITRGIVGGLSLWITASFFVPVWPQHLGFFLAFMVLSAMMMASLGIMLGFNCNRWDKLNAWIDFLVRPLLFLAGTFYSILILPKPLYHLSLLDPFFYAIDGYRYAFFGQSIINPWISLSILFVATLITWRLCTRAVRKRTF